MTHVEILRAIAVDAHAANVAANGAVNIAAKAAEYANNAVDAMMLALAAIKLIAVNAASVANTAKAVAAVTDRTVCRATDVVENLEPCSDDCNCDLE